jgi:hypothetical protein
MAVELIYNGTPGGGRIEAASSRHQAGRLAKLRHF